MKNVLLAGCEINPDTFEERVYIWDVEKNSYNMIDMNKIEALAMGNAFKHINLYQYIKREGEPPLNKSFEELKSIRWYDFDTFFHYIFHKKTRLNFDLSHDVIRQNPELFDDVVLKEHLIILGSDNKLPFEIVPMWNPKSIVNGWELQAKSHMIHIDGFFLSESEKVNHIKDYLIDLNPGNQRLHLYLIQTHTHFNNNQTILRVRCVLEDDTTIDKTI